MAYRYHTQDTISATVVEEQGNSLKLQLNDVIGIEEALGSNSHLNKTLRFKGKSYEVRCLITRKETKASLRDKQLRKESDDFWLKFPGIGKETVRLDVFYSHESGNTGRISYALYNSGEVWRLAYIGNPTTLMNGHNSAPVKLFSKPGIRENMELHRLGFKFFFKLLDMQMSEDVLSKLKAGDINLQNTQIAVHIQSLNKNADLHRLKELMIRPIPSDIKENLTFVGELLGVLPMISMEEDRAGLMIRKVTGEKDEPVFTVNFYDKALSNSLQGKKIPEDIVKRLEKCLRVDITLHKRYIERLAGRAATQCKERCKILKERGTKIPRVYEQFLSDMENNKKSTALSMCMIIHFLPKTTEDGRRSKEPFAKFLLREVICEELLLDKVIQTTNDKLELLQDDLNDKQWEIYSFWKSCKSRKEWENYKHDKSDTNAKRLAFSKIVKPLEEIMGVSMDVPYLFWLDTSTLDLVYGLSKQDKQRLNELRHKKTNQDRSKITAEIEKLLNKSSQTVRRDRLNLVETLIRPLKLK